MRSDVFIIGGCGHVGLPLGISFAKAGLQVLLFDLDEVRKAQVRAGEMPFIEYGADKLLQETVGKTLHVIDDLKDLPETRYIVITIGTPIDEYMNPQHAPLFDLIGNLAPYLRPGQHVVLRSTVFPGATRELHRRLTELDLDVRLTYCPERIAQGYAIKELDRLPQLVSGFSEDALDEALELFTHLTDRLFVVAVEEAELAKLFLNSWRYIQFAIANQFYMIAEERGLDFFRIHRAMTEGYDRARDFPLPGFTAGPCLLKDTMQLAAFERNAFQLGRAAMQVNEGLANFVVSRLRDSYDLSSSTVGILGMAFKGNIDDTRDSLAYKLRKLLIFHGARVLASDAFATDPDFVSTELLFTDSDVIVIGAPHEAYRALEFPPDKHVVDVWGFLGQPVEVPAP
jgi:UDP-N-acetyl-D-mannosaminuronic acid dehydrogenase